MAGTIDAPNGDTLYQLNAAQAPFVMFGGNHGDGSSAWVANLDPGGAQINVEYQGAHAGVESINLSGQGDWVEIPFGDITVVKITASSYPAIIGWAYLDPHMRVRSALVDVAEVGSQVGLFELSDGQTGAASAISATLGGTAGKTTYLAGFEVTGAGATAASVVAVTVVGIVGGTRTYYIAVPAGAAVGIAPLIVEFPRPIPASGPNVNIVVNVPSFGAGNTNEAVAAHGFRQ